MSYIEENSMHKQRVFKELAKYYTTLNHTLYVVKVLLYDVMLEDQFANYP